jgi:hypothetical protein
MTSLANEFDAFRIISESLGLKHDYFRVSGYVSMNMYSAVTSSKPPDHPDPAAERQLRTCAVENLNIIRMIKSRKVKCTGHARDVRNAYKIVVGK